MRTATLELQENEDIFIDCRPVTTYGGEVIINDDDVLPENSRVSTQMIDSVAINFSNGNITNNIGFQTFIGVGLLAILYGIGNYIFKEIPKNLIDKKLRQT